MKEPWNTEAWKDANLLYRVEVPEAERKMLDDTPEEYAVVDFPDAKSPRPVCMLWGRYGTRWEANVCGRWLVAHLLVAPLLGQIEQQKAVEAAERRDG